MRRTLRPFGNVTALPWYWRAIVSVPFPRSMSCQRTSIASPAAGLGEELEERLPPLRGSHEHVCELVGRECASRNRWVPGAVTTRELADGVGVTPAAMLELLEESRAAGVVEPSSTG